MMPLDYGSNPDRHVQIYVWCLPMDSSFKASHTCFEVHSATHITDNPHLVRYPVILPLHSISAS